MKTIKYLLFFVFFITAGCSNLLVNEPESNNNLTDYDAVHNIAKRVYPFFSFKKINWDSLYNKYKIAAVESKGDEIYTVLHELLRELKDGHIEIKTEGGFPIATYLWSRRVDRKSFDPLVVRKYFNKELKLAGEDRMEYEILNDQIGYVHITSFHEGSWVTEFDKVLEYLYSTKGLIIDVRNNEGGSVSTTDFIISRLIENKIQYSFYNFDKTERKTIIIPNKSLKYLKPVVILINGASFSAAELFPELLRQLPNVTLAGDTTGGGGGGIADFNLPSGKRIQLPFQYFLRLDGQMVEWNGVIPDIVIEQTENDAQNNRDKQLEFAINFLGK